MTEMLFKIKFNESDIHEVLNYDSPRPKYEIIKDKVRVIGEVDALRALCVECNATSGISFKEAFNALKEGKKIALPEWKGYWQKSPYGNTILMYCKDGRILNINGQMDDVFFTIDNICRDDWAILSDSYTISK